MPKPALDFYLLFVLPAWKEYQSQPKSLRHAMVLAIGLHHLADYVAMESYTGSDERSAMTAATTKVRLTFEARCQDLKLIGDIADAAKHSRLSTPKRGARLVFDSEQMRSTPGIFGAPFGMGVFNEATYLYVERPGAVRIPFDSVAIRVMRMWQGELGVELE